jgi:hypothetical protein
VNRLALVAVFFAASSASAEALAPLTKQEPGFGVAVNNPLMWRDQESIGASLYYRFAPKQVIRINLAHYKLAGTPAEHALGFLRDGYLDAPDDRYTGRKTDLSVGWIYFPRRAFDGPSIELGAVWRSTDQFGYNGRITNDELARALVGWSWLAHDHFFVAVAAGGAAGRANGSDDRAMMEVSTWTASFEGYVRLGFVFGN